MTNVPKPELERGAYIVYTDEPGEVLSPGSTGGGGIVYLQADREAGSPLLVPQFSFNQVKSAFESGNLAIIKAADEIMTDYLYVENLTEVPGDVYNIIASYGVGEISFTSNDPDELMTVDDS